MANTYDDWVTPGKSKKAAPLSKEDKALQVQKHLGAAQNYVAHLERHAKLQLEVKEWQERPEQPLEGDKTPTICYFLESRDDQQDQFRSAYGWSGPSADKSALKDLREKVNVSKDKETICAEENFATSHATLIKKCLYSIAFDKYGRKASCTNCFKVLQHYGVKDLHRG